jgi:hypothetical protein
MKFYSSNRGSDGQETDFSVAHPHGAQKSKSPAEAAKTTSWTDFHATACVNLGTSQSLSARSWNRILNCQTILPSGAEPLYLKGERFAKFSGTIRNPCGTLNILQTGGPKTYYILAASDAEALGIPQQAVDVPYIPDWDDLRRRDASVYTIKQQAGELILICPQAFYFGFYDNAGVDETVEFQMPADWQPQWKREVATALQSSTPLDLEYLRNLLVPSRSIQGPCPELDDLQKRVDEGDRWRRKAADYIEAHWKTLRQANEQVRRHLVGSLEDLPALVAEADKLGLSCSEVDDLRQMLTDARSIVRAAQEACRDPSKYCETLASQADDLEIPEREPLRLIRLAMEWMQGSQSQLNLEKCKNMLTFSQNLKQTGTPQYQGLEHRLSQGKNWVAEVRSLLPRRPLPVAKLEKLSHEYWAPGVSADATVLQELHKALADWRLVDEEAHDLVRESESQDGSNRPTLAKAIKVIDQLEKLDSLDPRLEVLRPKLESSRSWLKKGMKVFGESGEHDHTLLSLMENVHQGLMTMGDSSARTDVILRSISLRDVQGLLSEHDRLSFRPDRDSRPLLEKIINKLGGG